MDAIDPWDENRADLRAAEIAAATVNAQGCKKSGGGQFKPEDFLLYTKLQQDPEAIERARQADISAKFRAALMNVDGHKAKVN